MFFLVFFAMCVVGCFPAHFMMMLCIHSIPCVDSDDKG